MHKKIDKIFRKITNEIEQKFFSINKNIYPFTFDINIEDKFKTSNFSDAPTLVIKDYNTFIKKLTIYVSSVLSNKSNNKNIDIDEQIKLIIITLFFNATYEDFANPLEFIDKHTNFVENKNIIKDETIKNVSCLNNSDINLNIKEQNLFQESHFALDLSITNEINNELVHYKLPSVSFGIHNDTGYVYSIQKDKETNDSKNINQQQFEKKINRKLYMINKGYKQENNDVDSFIYEDIDNVYDVTHSFILSACILTSLLKKYGINKIEVIGYLPVRVNNKKISLETRFDDYKKELQKDTYIKYKDMLEKILYNITTKFVRNFNRITKYTNDIDIIHYANEIDSSMHLYVNNTNFNNELLNEVDMKINNNKNYVKKL